MLPLQQLLNRFKNLTNTDKIKKEFIVEVFKKNNIPITITQITLKNNLLFLKTAPIIKTETLLHKQQLLKEIHTIENLKSINDII